MVYLITSENRWMFAGDLAEMHRQRKAVFVDRAGWKVPVVEDMEVDQYDNEETMYLIAKGDGGRGPLLASARLLPTERAHLMSDLFLEACGGVAPRGPAVWEVSRFCIAAAVVGRMKRLRLLWEMTLAVIETALLFGIERVTFVAGRALLPLVLNCGWDAAPLGPTLPDGDDEITAVAAAISPHALQTVRRRFGVSAPVTRFPVPAVATAA